MTSNTNDQQAKVAIDRLNQLKQQLNLTPSAASKQTVIDMANERQAAEFNIGALARFYSGGEAAYLLRQNAYDYITNDPELVIQQPRNFLELERPEFREFTMGQVYRLAKITQELGPEQKEFTKELGRVIGIYSESFSMRYFVHDSLFHNVINMLSNDEQRKYWMPLVEEMRIIGCFAMTELGHSSALRELETTATYDIETDEFVMESPTITSAKVWIGMAGQSATHAVVIAQTVVNGQNKGLNWFVVQLRDGTSGGLMPNVMAGDIGSKVGHQGLDNGWIQFKKARIPRSQLLQKWVRLDRDGTWHPAPNPAIMYATLIPERLCSLRDMIRVTTQAVTIASRYGVVRRQGANNQQIMDYQSHYAKLLPAVAFMYMNRASFDTLDSQFSVLTGGGDSIDDGSVYLNHMSDLHAISAGLKGMVGWYCTDILETCRRSCGGHAYSSYNAIGNIMTDWGVFTTGGGDNVVMLQQTAKILQQRLVQQLERGIFPDLKFKSSAHYITKASYYLAKSSWTLDPAHLEDCLKDFTLLSDALYCILVKRLNSIRQSEQQGISENNLVLEKIRVAELHGATFLFDDNATRFGPVSSHLDPSVAKIMRRLTGLWGLHVLHTYSEQGTKEAFLTPPHVVAVEKLYYKMCKELRYQIIGLTDAWGYPDFVLKAPIAKYDGDIYEAYFDAILQAPNSTGVPAYHDKYIKPLTERIAN